VLSTREQPEPSGAFAAGTQLTHAPLNLWIVCEIEAKSFLFIAQPVDNRLRSVGANDPG
jgi:hypothetical protein